MSLNWFDALASTPTAGVWLDRRIITGSSLLETASPMLSKLGNVHDMAFTIEKVDALGTEFTTNDGFRYSMSSDKFAVDFQHRFKVRNYSGVEPVIEQLSEISPYSDLLPDVVDRLAKLTDSATLKQSRSLNKLGIVCTTRVDEAEMPPGLLEIIEYFKTPWPKAPTFYDIQMSTPLSELDKHSDNCRYHFQKPENPDEPGLIRLDYQRSFSSPRSTSSLRDAFASLLKDSIDHFIAIGQGERFDG